MSAEPKLQAPGAGLPWPQMLGIKLWIGPFVSKRQPPAETRKNYELFTTKTIEKASSVDAAKRNTKVLIKPMTGLEDSSRYWSINGVLEHLLIVSRGMEAAILALSSGTVPPEKADTAKVKPKSEKTDFLPEFIAFAPQLMKTLDSKLAQPGMNFDSKLTYRHPWFGPITAKQWYWMLMAHAGLHYRQSKEIIKGLP